MKDPRKYFIAIVLPEPYLSEAEAIKQDLFHEYGLKGALRCPAHITLHRPFVWEQGKENRLIKALQEFEFEESIEIKLNNFSFFPPRVVFIDVIPEPKLIEMHDKLLRHVKLKLNLFNEAEDLRGFHPHVTVASRDLKKNQFPELQEKFRNRRFAAKFSVESISLLKLSTTWEILFQAPI